MGFGTERFQLSACFLRNIIFIIAMSLVLGVITTFLISRDASNLLLFLPLMLMMLLLPEKALIGGMFLLVSTSPWLNYRILGGRLEHVATIPLLITFALVYVWLLILAQRRVQIVKSPVNTFIVLFIGANFLSTILNYPGFHTRHLILGNVLHLLNFSLFYVVASMIAFSVGNSRRIAILLLVGIMAGAIGAGISQGHTFLHSSKVLWKTNPVYTASFARGGLGGFGSIVVLMVLAVLFEIKNRPLKYCIAPLFLLGISIDLLAWQRIHFVSLFAGMGMILFTKGRKWLFVFAILIVLIINFFPTIPNTIHDVFAFQPQNFQVRVELWKEAFQVWKNHPIIGVGPSQYRGGISWTHPHNQYITILAETGLLGLASFILLFVIFFRVTWITYRRAKDPLLRMVALGLLGVLVQQAIGGLAEGSFLPHYGRDQFVTLSTSVYVWVLIGLMVGLRAKFLFQDLENGQ